MSENTLYSHKTSKAIFFLLYIAFFFLLPVFFVSLLFQFSTRHMELFVYMLVVLSLIYVPHEWKKFSQHHYGKHFFLWIVNLLIVFFMSGFSSVVFVIVVSWAITFSSILCTDVFLSYKKQIARIRKQKAEWKRRVTPFLKNYWKREYRKNMLESFFGDDMLFLVLSCSITIALFLLIIFPLYVFQYQYPVSILLGIHVCTSFVWGVYRSVRT